jgi:hypothetical protein
VQGQVRPWVPLVRRGRVGQRGPEALAVRVRRRVQLGLGHRPAPAAPAVRLVRAVPKGQPGPAPRRRPGDRRVLAGLAPPAGRPGQLGREGPPRQQDRKDPAVPCKPPTRLSRWQQEWSPTVASATFLYDAAAMMLAQLSHRLPEARILLGCDNAARCRKSDAVAIEAHTAPHHCCSSSPCWPSPI